MLQSYNKKHKVKRPNQEVVTHLISAFHLSNNQRIKILIGLSLDVLGYLHKT